MIEIIKNINNANYVSLPNGKSHYEFNCPFYNSKAIMYCWVGHKKCSCGAKFSTLFDGVYILNAKKEQR